MVLFIYFLIFNLGLAISLLLLMKSNVGLSDPITQDVFNFVAFIQHRFVH